MAPKSPGRWAALVVTALAAGAALAAGCSSQEEETPGACLVSSDAYLQALRAAPGEVTLDGTPISDCLTPDQEGGDLARVGEEMVVAATTLNAQARKDPDGPAAVQLGYLIGAVSEGADSIHADLVLRLNSAANYSPNQLQAAEFQRDFGRGFAAGQESG